MDRGSTEYLGPLYSHPLSEADWGPFSHAPAGHRADTERQGLAERGLELDDATPSSLGQPGTHHVICTPYAPCTEICKVGSYVITNTVAEELAVRWQLRH